LYLHRGRGVLPLPARAMELDKLAVVRLSKNPLGAVKVDEGLGLVTYQDRVPLLDLRRPAARPDTARGLPPPHALRTLRVLRDRHRPAAPRGGRARALRDRLL